MENLAPSVLKNVMTQLRDLSNHPIDGLVVYINEHNLTDIRADLSGPESTPYAGGVFKIQLSLPQEYPAVAPKGKFITKIFHPNVSEAAGEICVNTLKRDWNAKTGLRHVFTVIRCLLIDPNPESALNEDAGKLLLDDYAEFAKRAKLWTEVYAAATNVSDTQPTAGAGLGTAAPLNTTNAKAKIDPTKKKKSLRRL